MTGIRAGSGGTGLRSGSQGTGVSGVSPLAPTTPTGLAVAVVSPTALTVSWDDVVDETSYELEVSINGAGYVSAVGSPYAADVVSVPLTGLVPAVFYCYRVRATNAFGSSAWSSSVCQFTPNGTENVLVELNSVSVGTYTAPFDLNPASVSDSLTTPVPNPIMTIAAAETIAPADVQTATVVDALTTPVPAAIVDIAATETIAAADVQTATVADALTTPAPIASLRAAVLALSPDGYWILNDSASPPQDSSVNNRDISATTGITYRTTAGQFGSFVTIPANGKMPVADNTAWSPSVAGFTYFALVRPTSLALGRQLICKGPGFWEWAIEQEADGSIRSYIMTSAGALVRQNKAPAGTLVVNQWVALCVTIQGVDTAATIVNYKNSNTPLASTITTGAGSVTNGVAVLEIGAQTDLTTRGAQGSMAHVAIFPGIKSGAEIQSLMDAATAEGWI